jgi:hypothetical protein
VFPNLAEEAMTLISMVTNSDPSEVAMMAGIVKDIYWIEDGNQMALVLV